MKIEKTIIWFCEKTRKTKPHRDLTSLKECRLLVGTLCVLPHSKNLNVIFLNSACLDIFEVDTWASRLLLKEITQLKCIF